MRHFPFFRLTVCALLACACSAALAQYAWIDANGVKQYSDKPPPPAVPASRIMKAPVTPSAPTQAGAAPSVAEREADYEKRRAAAQKKQREADEQAGFDAKRNSGCDAARSRSRALASGERLVHIDANGERHYLDDEERAREMREVQRTLDECN
jgi:hypothetical protein